MSKDRQHDALAALLRDGKPLATVLCACIALGGAACGDTPGNGFSTQIRRLTLGSVDANAATVGVDLYTAEPLRISFRPSGGAEEWIEGPVLAPSHHHETDLAPLDARTTYEYRLEVGQLPAYTADASGQTLSFETPAARDTDEFVSACALVIADPQNGVFGEALGHMQGLRDDVDLVLSLGDQVTVAEALTPDDADSLYLDYLLGPLGTLAAHMPLLTTVGNHDMGDSFDAPIRAAALDLYAQHMVLPDNGPMDAPEETVYSFDWESLHVAVLDSTGPSAMREWGSLDARQLAWLGEDMGRARDDQWRIVALHHMVHGWQTPDAPPPAEWFHIDNFEQAHQAFVTAGVDLVLNGHRHAYNVFVLDGVRYVTFPTLSRDMILFDRFGAANWRNLGGEEGTLDRAVSDVFGYATLCGDETALTLDVALYDGLRPGLAPVSAEAEVFTR